MIRLLALIGLKKYDINIYWDDGCREQVSVMAWSSEGAIMKVSRTKDIVSRAKMTIT